MDAPGHATRSADEQVILSAYLTHLAQVLHHVKGRCPLTLLVTGAAAGGIYVSLACPADRVWALPHASIMELPPQAVAQVLGAAEAEDRGPERLLELGVVDRMLTADEFARAGRALFDRSLP
jgi:acetyl-CoA carboxylase beta subunit